MKQPVPILPFYLIALFFIVRSSAVRGKTLMWMLITLLVTIAIFVALAGLVSSPEAAYGLGGLGSLVGMIASVAVGLKHRIAHTGRLGKADQTTNAMNTSPGRKENTK